MGPDPPGSNSMSWAILNTESKYTCTQDQDSDDITKLKQLALADLRHTMSDILVFFTL